MLQTSLSYGLLVPVLAVWGIVGLGAASSRTRRESPDEWPGVRHRLRVVGGVTSVLVALGWLQPLIEQFTATGKGNLTQLFRSLAHSVRTIGFVDGPRVFAKVVSLPPFWFRSSMRDAFSFSPFGTPLPSKIGAVLSLVLLVGLLLACARVLRVAADRTAFNAVVTAAILVVLGLPTAARSPGAEFGTAAYQLRWVWPVAAFVWFAIILAVVRRVAVPPSRSIAVTVALSLVTVLAVGANLPTSNQGTNVPSRSEPIARALLAQLGPLRAQSPVRFETFGNVFDPYGPAVVGELRRRGIRFYVAPSDKIGVRQFGRNRLSPGDRFLKGDVFVFTGDRVRDTPLLASRVALVEGLTSTAQRELADLRRGSPTMSGRGVCTSTRAADGPSSGERSRASRSDRLRPRSPTRCSGSAPRRSATTHATSRSSCVSTCSSPTPGPRPSGATSSSRSAGTPRPRRSSCGRCRCRSCRPARLPPRHRLRWRAPDEVDRA